LSQTVARPLSWRLFPKMGEEDGTHHIRAYVLMVNVHTRHSAVCSMAGVIETCLEDSNMETLIRIPSLIINKTPVWFDVLGESLQSVEFSAWPKYGPIKLQGDALFTLDFSHPIDEATLHALNIRQSPIGPYVYVDGVDEQGMIRQTLAIPTGKIKRIGLRLWN